MHDACAGMPRDVCDVVAESVAYAVCSRFGLDLSLRSVDDVAGWLDDPEAVTRARSRSATNAGAYRTGVPGVGAFASRLRDRGAERGCATVSGWPPVARR